MGWLARILKRRSWGEKATLMHFFVTFDYPKKYEDFLEFAEETESQDRDNVLIELMIFRAWTTQFGFHMWSTDSKASKAIYFETAALAATWGLGALLSVFGVDSSKVPREGFESLMEGRWNAYDAVLKPSSQGGFIEIVKVAGPRLCRQAADFCGVESPVAHLMLLKQFFDQFAEIREQAIRIGLLK